MKPLNKLFTTLLLVIFSSANAQLSDNWTWLNPKPQGNTLYAMDFVNDNTGFTAGNYGTILKTNDKGDNWIKLNSGTSSKF